MDHLFPDLQVHLPQNNTQSMLYSESGTTTTSTSAPSTSSNAFAENNSRADGTPDLGMPAGMDGIMESLSEELDGASIPSQHDDMDVSDMKSMYGIDGDNVEEEAAAPLPSSGVSQ
jgi:hypothetical protein